MKQKESSYPSFKANQILSADDLNNSFNYLNEQIRLTRANLIGTGIVCGLKLKPSLSEDGSSISISKGCGVTTDGHLIAEDQEIILQSLKKDVYHLIINEEKISCTELSIDPPSDEADAIIKGTLDGNILLLHLKISKDSEDSSPCTTLEKGDEVTTTVRYLLVEKTAFNLQKIAGEKRWPAAADNPQLEPVSMLRIHLSLSENVIDRKVVKNAFVNSIGKVAQDIKGALIEAYDIFKPVLQDNHQDFPFNMSISSDPFLEKLFNDGQSLPVLSDDLFFQNYYDFFVDLLKAYEEFRQCGLELLRTCCISENPFPTYLILGDISDTPSPSSCRHYFQPSTADKDCTEKVRRLFDRIVNMVKYFNASPVSLEIDSIILTPSVYGSVPLSDRAVPYYYYQKAEKEALSYTDWTCKDKSKHSTDDGLGYWYQDGTDSKSNLLNFDLEPYNFIRIEGHLGKKYDDVFGEKGKIGTLRYYDHNHPLPLEIISLYAHDKFDIERTKEILDQEGSAFLRHSLISFLKRHSGIQHKAGVPLGGTFIIVFDINKENKLNNVIADFSLPYHCCVDSVPPLALDVTLHCTDRLTGFASATVTPSGLPPYFYQLDKQPFDELIIKEKNINGLAEGSHMLLVCDSTGAESVQHLLHVPNSLTTGPLRFNDISDEEYTVSFDIVGGTLPSNQKSYIKYSNGKYTYRRNRKSADNDITVTIKDTSNCSKQIILPAHTVCKLPCKGQSTRCDYRLWLQKPTDDEKITKYTRKGEIRFVFNGENISLPNSESLLQLSVDPLTKENFDNAVSCAVKRLNNAINHALSYAGFGDNRLFIQYQPDEENDPFSILWIEYFDCVDEKFSIEFDFDIESSGTKTMRYAKNEDSNGSVLTIAKDTGNEKEIPVPAFDCSTRNQYSDDDPQKPCSDSEFTANINVMRDNNTFTCTGDVSDIDNNSVAAWVWDFPKTQTEEPFYQGSTVTVTSDNLSEPINLTAITEDGCFAKADPVTFQDALSDDGS